MLDIFKIKTGELKSFQNMSKQTKNNFLKKFIVCP